MTTGQGLLATLYKHDIEISISMKGDNFLDSLSNPGAQVSSRERITQRKLNLSYKKRINYFYCNVESNIYVKFVIKDEDIIKIFSVRL
jgi:hypothetical protein